MMSNTYIRNVYIRNIYAPGFSFITLSFFKTNLSISFSRWLGRDENGFSKYDTKNYISTTISDENVAALYLLSNRIVNEKLTNPVQFTIPCNKQSTITFESGIDQEGQMKIRLYIEKGKETILFEFPIHKYKTRENDQIVEKTIQTGLIVFEEALQAYLTAIGADRQPEKLSEKALNPPAKPSTSLWS